MTDYGIDGHKLHYHPREVAALLDAEDDPEKLLSIYPIYVEVSPVGACNHRCSFCAVDYIGYQSANRLDIDIAKRMLDDMAVGGVKSVMFAGEGEPLLHKKINEMVSHAKRQLIDVSFTTNAVLLNQKFTEQSLEHISWIKASVNAGSAESYAKVHQTKEKEFQLVIDNLAKAVKFRNDHGLDCAIGLQSLLLPENASEMLELGKIARDEIGADYFVVKPFSQEPSSLNTIYKEIDYRDDELLSCQQAVNDLERPGFSVSFRSKTMEYYHEEQPQRYSTCYSTPVYMAYIMSEGSVYGCKDHLLDPRFCYGNVNEQGFKEIWLGDKRKQGIDFVLNNLDVKTCRVNCRMDKVNRFLFDLKQDRVKHINFI